MATLDEVVEFLNSELKTSSISDFPGAINGLQLANGGQIGKVFAAVDASLSVINAAANEGPSLLIVHHGMFWQGAQPLTGAFFRKIKIAMDAELAIYSSHLPLDIHPQLGNNILLANAIGLQDAEPFFEQKGNLLGVRGNWNGTREQLVNSLKTVLNGPVHLCPGGGEKIARLGIITGGAGSEAARVAAAGVDSFITGEGPHWSYTLAEELGINVFYGGHYATETFGVKALTELIGSKFDLAWEFLDFPTGM
jgi:dinuclear metal center YbgI/SA1388 family protein